VDTDVIIMGGGLAGLTLSLQLQQKMPHLRITVIERRKHPVPHAAHKVGESSVEIGAHYFETVLGLKPHLDQAQLKKFGFRFFFSDGRRDLDNVTELGASKVLATPSYQLDRGIFENQLATLAKQRGIAFYDAAVIRSFDLAVDLKSRRNRQASLASTSAEVPGNDFHTVRFDQAEVRHTLTARWLIDSSGRAGLIKKKLDLEQLNDHNANAVWFRIADRIDVNDWSTNEAWLDRTMPRNRWLSTNHLVGEGYWVWLIPLASGSHSVGIVADAKLHPIESMNTFEKAMQWLSKHQPRLHDELSSKLFADSTKLQDFAFFKRFSYGCKKLFSGGQRWALTGEAGLFLDPFYSPGSDFIAIANTYITELIALDQVQGPVAMTAQIYEQIYFSLYQNMLTLYTDQYKIFGDPEVMPVKVIWDYTYYWGVMCQLFFQNKLTDVSVMARMSQKLGQVQELNKQMQLFLREWNNVSAKRNHAQMLDQADLPWFAKLNKELRDDLDHQQFFQRIDEQLVQLHELAAEIVWKAAKEYPVLVNEGLVAQINPTILAHAKDRHVRFLFGAAA
jgi:flavin-dependent dehydrogenase